jgi:hypothetical protein
MSNKTVPDLKELFKQAAEIAAQVPESMREAAFNRALDMLAGTQAPASAAQQVRRPAASKKRSARASEDGEDSQIELLIQSINSTQHPGVISATRALDRALMVLQIARQDHGVDGLSPKAIARILTEKFRVRTTDGAVRMALGGAANLVNRVASGSGFGYQIMGPGEDYLAHATDSGEEATSRVPSRRRIAKHGARRKKTSSKLETGSTQAATKNASAKKIVSRANKAGPKAEIVSLVTSGYFSNPRTPAEIQDFLKKKRGHAFGAAQISLALLRLVRDKVLDRDENAEGQYEYRQP